VVKRFRVSSVEALCLRILLQSVNVSKKVRLDRRDCRQKDRVESPKHLAFPTTCRYSCIKLACDNASIPLRTRLQLCSYRAPVWRKISALLKMKSPAVECGRAPIHTFSTARDIPGHGWTSIEVRLTHIHRISSSGRKRDLLMLSSTPADLLHIFGACWCDHTHIAPAHRANCSCHDPAKIPRTRGFQGQHHIRNDVDGIGCDLQEKNRAGDLARPQRDLPPLLP